MYNAFRHHESLSRRQLHRAILEINHKSSLDYVEKFIIVVVLMPVILALYDAQPHHRSIHLAERLVVPLVRTRVRQRLFFDHLQWLVIKVESRLIRKRIYAPHSPPLYAVHRIASDGQTNYIFWISFISYGKDHGPRIARQEMLAVLKSVTVKD